MYDTPTQVRDSDLCETWLFSKGFTKEQITHIKGRYESEGLQYCIKSLKAFDVKEMKSYFKSDEYKKLNRLNSKIDFKLDKDSMLDYNHFIFDLLDSCEGVDAKLAAKNLNLKL